MNAHPQLEVVGEAGDGLEAIGWSAPEAWRGVMDVNMPPMRRGAGNQTDQGGISRSTFAVSMHNSSDMVERMQQAGACGYLTKERCRGQLCGAIVAATVSTP